MPRRRDYSRRPATAYLSYPAQVLDPVALSHMGVIAGTRPDENPPKVVMTGEHWDTLLANRRAAKRAIHFLGTTHEDNPLIPQPKGFKPAVPVRAPKPYRPKKPSPYAYLFALAPAAALAQVEHEHQQRVAGGMEAEDSLALMVKALAAVKRHAANRIEPRPLPAMEGEDPPTPTELRKGLVAY